MTGLILISSRMSPWYILLTFYRSNEEIPAIWSGLVLLTIEFASDLAAGLLDVDTCTSAYNLTEIFG